jgi:hypothetical protein
VLPEWNWWIYAMATKLTGVILASAVGVLGIYPKTRGTRKIQNSSGLIKPMTTQLKPRLISSLNRA